MIKTYFKTALRNLIKRPFYNGLNITAVTLSMSVSLIILFVIFNQFDYDAANPNKDRIFRLGTAVTGKSGDQARYATVPYEMAKLLDSSLIDSWVNLVPLPSRAIINGSKSLNASGALSTGNYFDLFDIPIISGQWNESSTLNSKIALSRTTARRMFNTTECIGQSLQVEGVGAFIVSAVFDDDVKSHIENEFIISGGNIPMLISQRQLDSSFKSTANYTASYLYVVASPGIETTTINSMARGLTNRIMADFRPKNEERNISFFVQSLTDLAPSQNLWLENSKALTTSTITVFLLIVLALVLLTAFNYSSVMIALGLSRSREIGVRKIVGARRSDVFLQFIIEAVVLALISLVLGLLLFPIISSFGPFEKFLEDAHFNAGVIVVFFVFAVVVGVAAGTFPALILSAYKEINLLNNLLNKNVVKGLSFRKVIIVLQFSISYGLVLFVFVLFFQTRYMANGNYGFSYENTISVRINDQREHAIIHHALANYPGVISVSAISTNLGYMPTEQYDAWNTSKTERINFSSYYVDHVAIKDLKLTLLEGKNFSANASANANLVLINETGYKMLKFRSASEAIAQQFNLDDTTQVRILGVIKDFHFQNFKRPIGPMIFRFDPAKLVIVNAYVHPSKFETVMQMLTSKKMTKAVGRPLDVLVWNETFREIQSHKGDVLTVTFFTLAFFAIGCLGLIGVVTYSTNQRIKETTLRKIMGASFVQIFSLLTREYLLLLGIAFCIGLPAGLFVANEYLSEYAYRIQLNLGLIAFTFIVIALIGFLILLSVTLKNCLAKPIDNLRQ